MTVTDIISLCNAGYNHEQIMQLAQAQQMERMQQAQNPQPATPAVQPVQQISSAALQQLAAPVVQAQIQQQPAAQNVQPDPYNAIMGELLGLKQAVQAGNLMAAQQPAQPMSADDIIANIIAPKPRKENE